MDLKTTVLHITDSFTEEEMYCLLFLINGCIPRNCNAVKISDLIIETLSKSTQWDICLTQCLYVLRKIELLLNLFQVTKEDVKQSFFTQLQLETHVLTLVNVNNNLTAKDEKRLCFILDQFFPRNVVASSVILCVFSNMLCEMPVLECLCQLKKCLKQIGRSDLAKTV
uniref:FLIP protein n=2 Tax=Saimiriine herpesvirus 2 TaxID=10381 RepID=O56959_SHV2|nr:FLIP [Saimiriine gammaherpesvirus 2]CAC84369.1 viral FLICE inhibitory protein [Saimiriine gammaherpesvirus 2]